MVFVPVFIVTPISARGPFVPQKGAELVMDNVSAAGGAVTLFRTTQSTSALPIVVTWEEASLDWSDDFVVVAAPPDLIEPFGELLYEAGALSGP